MNKIKQLIIFTIILLGCTYPLMSRADEPYNVNIHFISQIPEKTLEVNSEWIDANGQQKSDSFVITSRIRPKVEQKKMIDPFEEKNADVKTRNMTLSSETPNFTITSIRDVEKNEDLSNVTCKPTLDSTRIHEYTVIFINNQSFGGDMIGCVVLYGRPSEKDQILGDSNPNSL